MYNNIKLEKGLYSITGKTFTQALAELDPDANYENTELKGLDAFERQLKRFDIKGKDYLRTLGKYYIVDPGLRTYLLGNRGGDVGHILENIVYFELLRRGYEVAIGKVGEKEIDFIATKMNEKKYIQVTDNMNAPETRARELAPLQAVQDNYEKIVIAMDCDLISDVDGIKIVKALDFLLNEG